MPLQLIYTSAPQGVDAGRSGYCTVARSGTMGESLIHRLEQLSYYERLSEHGGATERTVFAFRNLDIRGKTFHVLSRIKDAPADYTGRTNFIAHHLVFTPEEVAEMPVPAVIFRRWPHWQDAWREEPRLLENEPWPEREELKDRTFLPANNWYRETGDHARASGLLGFNSGVFVAHQFRPETILDLLAEALDLLQLEGPNWRTLAWQRTFSVGCQPQDNPADFRWRFLTSYLPFESAVPQGRAPEELGKLRPAANSRQVEFCKKDPADPQFTRLPRAGTAVRITEGEPLVLDCEAQSLPGEIIYRWYAVGKDNTTEEEVVGAYTGKLELPNIGRGKWRYKVRAWDSITNKCAESPLIIVEVEEKRRGVPWTPPPSAAPASPVKESSKEQKKSLRFQQRNSLSDSDRNRTSDSSNNSSLTPQSNSNSNHNGKVLVVGVLVLLICVFVLFRLEFFDPALGFRHFGDWWQLQVRRNPLAFQNNAIVSAKVTAAIKDYNTTKKDRDAVLVRIKNELKEHYQNQQKHPHSSKPGSQSTTKGKDRTGAGEENNNQTKNIGRIDNQIAPGQTSAEPPKHGPVFDPEKLSTNASAKSAAQLLKATSTEDSEPIYVIAAITEWDKETNRRSNILAYATQQLATYPTNSTVKDKFKDATNAVYQLTNRIARASQIQYPKSWPQLPATNNTPPPTLIWTELGKEFHSRNIVIGEPVTSGEPPVTNHWVFIHKNWSLTISKTNAIYKAPMQSGAVRFNLATDNGAYPANERLRLLLFADNTNKAFQANIADDNLNPSPDLSKLLAGLVLQSNNALRLVGTYPTATNSMIYALEDIHGVNNTKKPWKLGIMAQLSKKAAEVQKLVKMETALDRVDVFWKTVQTDYSAHLPKLEFQEAVDLPGPGSNKTKFWNLLNRLCVVAIYERFDESRQFKLDLEPDTEIWKRLDMEMETQSRRYRTQLKELIDNIFDLKSFWIEFGSQKKGDGTTFQYHRQALSKRIGELRKAGGAIDPTKLEIDLEFKLMDTWIKITRLDCRP